MRPGNSDRMKTPFLATRMGKSEAWRLVRRYTQFCVVGGSGLVVDMALLHVLASPALLGWNLSLSKALAAEAGLVNNFIWNELWTFRDLAQGGSAPARLGVGENQRRAVAGARLNPLNGFNGVDRTRWADCDGRSSMAPPEHSSARRGSSLGARARRFVKFNLICTAGIGLSVLLLNAQVYGLGWNVYVSNFLAIVLVSLWNFWLNWKFGWGGSSGRAQP